MNKLKEARLIFGDEEQINIIKKEEEKKKDLEENGKEVIYTERTIFSVECPYCGNPSDEFEDEDEAFEDIIRVLDNGDTLCDSCGKKLKQ